MNANFISTLRSYLDDFEIRPITRGTCYRVMPVFDSNNEFFMLTEGKPITLRSCQANIEAIPPGFDINNKLYLGFWHNKMCAAVLDLLIGYPKPDCLYIGLLLVHGELQGTGVGRKIVEALAAAWKGTGIKAANLAVVEDNKKAIAFWKKHGFKRTGTSTAIVGDTCVNVVTMVRNL
ncbi:MAG: GNAT family N-acetyltransferase [Firmicutes bacterium]|nr:GNAT family N-acetyltransferase [Bacillota bacterium]